MTLELLKKKIPKIFTMDIDFLDKVIKQIDLDTNSKILDVGTGFGIMAIILALNGFDVLTGEPEENPERNGFEHYHEHHKGYHKKFNYNWKKSAKTVGVEEKIKYQHFDAQDLPFLDESFDGVFLYDALQHIKDRKLALKECIRVLRHEGTIGIIETNKKGIEYYHKTEGFTINYIDPTELIKQNNISFDLIEGKLVNCYILKKKKLSYRTKDF